MKRILVLAIMVVLMAGCSDDDGVSGKKLYLKSMYLLSTGGNGSEYDFTYNDEKQLTGISTGGGNIDITYEDNRLKSMIDPKDGSGYEFSYVDGILSSINNAGTAYDVVYDSADRKYTIAGMESEFELTKNNDIAVVRTLGANPDAIPYTYNDKNKGGLYNLTTDYNFLIFYLLKSPFMVSRMPLSSYGIYTVNNTYNSDGYVTRADFMGGTQLIASFTYEYQEL